MALEKVAKIITPEHKVVQAFFYNPATKQFAIEMQPTKSGTSPYTEQLEIYSKTLDESLDSIKNDIVFTNANRKLFLEEDQFGGHSQSLAYLETDENHPNYWLTGAGVNKPTFHKNKHGDTIENTLWDTEILAITDDDQHVPIIINNLESIKTYYLNSINNSSSDYKELSNSTIERTEFTPIVSDDLHYLKIYLVNSTSDPQGGQNILWSTFDVQDLINLINKAYDNKQENVSLTNLDGRYDYIENNFISAKYLTLDYVFDTDSSHSISMQGFAGNIDNDFWMSSQFGPDDVKKDKDDRYLSDYNQYRAILYLSEYSLSNIPRVQDYSKHDFNIGNLPKNFKTEFEGVQCISNDSENSYKDTLFLNIAYHDVYFEQGKFYAPTVANCLFKDVNL